MAQYRISPTGVEAVLKKTESDAEQFGTILKPLEGFVESAAKATDDSGAIVPALQSFFEVQSGQLTSINTRVGAALNGAYNATMAYIHGDLEMVGEYQQAAESEANPQVTSRPYGMERAQ